MMMLMACGAHTVVAPPSRPLLPASPAPTSSSIARAPAPSDGKRDRCSTILAAHPGSGVRRFCGTSKEGKTWAVFVDDDDLTVLVHEDLNGQQITTTLPPVGSAPLRSTRGEESAVLFDFDGDGDPELFFTLVAQAYQDQVVRRAFVTVHEGRIVTYDKAPSSIDTLTDFDGDGRPDAVVSVDLGDFKGCDYCSSTTFEETFLATSKSDGTFSTTDDVARRYMRERCPSRPSGPLIAGNDISLDRMICSRVWGVSTQALESELALQCARHASQAAQCQGPCRYLGLLRMAASYDPPIRL